MVVISKRISSQKFISTSTLRFLLYRWKTITIFSKYDLVALADTLTGLIASNDVFMRSGHLAQIASVPNIIISAYREQVTGMPFGMFDFFRQALSSPSLAFCLLLCLASDSSSQKSEKPSGYVSDSCGCGLYSLCCAKGKSQGFSNKAIRRFSWVFFTSDSQ